MKSRIVLMVIMLTLLAGCVKATPAVSPEAPRVLRVMVYDSFSVSEDVIARFETANNATVQFLKAGDAGKMLNQAILSRDNPQADVLYGLDNTFLSRALNADIFEPYQAKNLSVIPKALHLDNKYRVVPTDYGDVCLNYDKAYFAEHSLALPQSLTDLTQPEYRGLLVVENPASSSPGLAFLLTTIGAFGADGYLDFWEDLRANDVLVVDGWDTAYYNEFSGSSGSDGVRPLVVSYATSPAAEVYFSAGALTEPPTGAITAPGTCFRQVEFAGILKGTQNRDLAEAFIEFLLSADFQTDIPLQMWVFPANPTIALPQVFVEFTLEAVQPAEVPAEAIEANREKWIEAWADVVLR
ncbi:MAG TPA: thiamine ABC transporter substrate-binding protein [Anaerolineae bacterium]|nr:thiamine ABC transporter substrate-binding protein [Anaerolineae bacterium]HQH37245.1 thiamine ABC transporter substrate-binding protein [Anaerolineae bacterium]